MSRGGVRQGAGRPKGSLNRATIYQKGSLAELARTHTDDALATLVDVMHNSPMPTARISAACALLDRGYGKPVSKPEIIENKAGDVEMHKAIERLSPEGAAKLLAMIDEVSLAFKLPS